MTTQAILRCLCRRRFPLSSETELQRHIHDALTADGIAAEREVRLSKEDRIDFMCGPIGIEVKLSSGGGKMEIYRQLERYAEHEEVGEIILVTSIAMALPTTIKGKPAHLFSLARNWL